LQKKLTKNYFEEKIKIPFGMILRAVQKGKTLGFVVWLQENSKVAYIWWLIVLPQWQNKGIGKRLFKAALKEIQKRNYQRVWAKIKNDNFATLSLVLKFQFYIKGISNEDGILTILVEKDLTEEKTSREPLLN
jgi:ribosomal protein S18 acetylase RimI-like enzyme